jgi:hypothetical protein
MVKDEKGNTVYVSEAQSPGIASIDLLRAKSACGAASSVQSAGKDSIWMLIAQSAR